jgi:hypothetical protein
MNSLLMADSTAHGVKKYKKEARKIKARETEKITLKIVKMLMRLPKLDIYDRIEISLQ